MTNPVDVAAYIWPAYGFNDPRSSMYWPQGIGEWQTVMIDEPKYPGHLQPRQPAWGYVNEADPAVMEMQIDAAADHGVNVFIYDWYWYEGEPFLESCLNDGYLGARNNDRVSFYLMWANHDAGTIWDRRISDRGDRRVWSGAVDRDEFEAIASRLIERYFAHPSYYRIDGKPVFMIYDIEQLVRGLGGVAQTIDAFEWFRGAARRAGLDGLHLQGAIRGRAGDAVGGVESDFHDTDAGTVNTLGFDSVTHYQFVHFAELGSTLEFDYAGIVDQLGGYWDAATSDHSAPYVPHVSVGWDGNPRYTTLQDHIARGNDPIQVERALTLARDRVLANPSLPQLVTVNSWNEWTETSYLQPDDLYGYGYLDAVRRVFTAGQDL